LIVLAPDNDPFYIGTQGHVRDAEWFAGLLDRFGLQLGAHIRRVHYRMITLPSGEVIMLPDGQPYLNTLTCWGRLGMASKFARILGLVDVESMVDRRNDDAIENSVARDATSQRPWIGPASAYWTLPEPVYLEIPPLPDFDRLGDVEAELYGPYISGYDFHSGEEQPVMIEVWVEKSTMNDILDPLCRRLGLNYVEGTGFESITQTVAFLRRAQRYGKAAHIIYVSDFDPAGVGMPVAVARQVQFWLEQLDIDVEISVDTSVLTHEQCVAYELPRTPIKDTDLRKDNFEARYGEGATELDALEALHPGELANLIRRAAEQFTDHGLHRRFEEVRGQLYAEGGPYGQLAQEWVARGGPWLENRMRDLTEDANSIAAEGAERVRVILERIREELLQARSEARQVAEETRERLQWFDEAAGALRRDVWAASAGIGSEIKLPERPRAEVAPDPGVLFDSRRHWLDQLAAFKAAQNGHSNGGGA
jgi:hypothetical protein